MLNALLIGNRSSGSGHRLSKLDIPGRWILDPSTVTVEDVLAADLIALFGGDGTMQRTVSQILRDLPAERLPPVAILPFGTTNMNAKDLNSSGSRQAAVASLKRALVTGQYESQLRPLLQVSQGGHREYGFFLGLGIIAEVVERWNAERKPGATANQLRSLWAMVTGLRSASTACEIKLNGEQHSVYGLLATTLERLLFGSRPYWGDAPRGSLRLTWIDATAQNLLRHAPALLRGQAHLEGQPGFESLAPGCATLEFDGPFIIDGEIFRSNADKLTITRSGPIRWLDLSKP